MTDALPEPPSPRRLARGLALVVVAGGIALRFLLLGADPYYYEWNGYITDEGRWIAHARALLLFGGMGSVGSTLHLMLAPLYQAASYAVFTLLDVSLWSARLISAASGSALLLAFWAFARRSASPEALLLVLVMLAVEMDLVVLSRLAVPEMAAMALTFGAFVLLADEGAGRARLAAAGLLTAAAVGVKATALPAAPIFAAILLLRRPRPGQGGRVAAVGAFLAGFLAPALAAAAAAVLLLPASGAVVRAVRGFVAPADLYALVAFPFDDLFASTLGIWGLAAWLGLLGWIAAGRVSGEEHTRPLLFGAAVWAGLFAPLMMLLDYFPSRYKLHVLIPLAVIAAVGITRFQAVGLDGLRSRLAGLSTAPRAAAALLVALPAALPAGAALASLAPLAGLDPERIRVRYGAVLLAFAVGAAVVALGRGRGSSVLVCFPVCWLSGWLIAARLSLTPPLFWPTGSDGQGLRWLLVLGAVLAALAIGAARTERWDPPAATVALVAAAGLYAGLGLIRLAPGYLEPHYTMREASREIGALLAGAPGWIDVYGGDALFSENRLPYRSLLGARWSGSPAGALVVAGLIKDPDGRLGREYRLVRQYSIYTSPEYVLGEGSWTPTEGPAQRMNVRVYRRVEGG